ncbi:MAG: carbohydrate kinase [Fermentimonas sp.]|nr:carbohydrate kinase [Fermentimonas sp.]
MNNIIVGLGEILWDLFSDQKVLGGAPANFAYHVSQLGYEGYAVSAIGNDPLGSEIISSLKEKNLKYMIETTDYPTGIVNVTLNDKGIPQYEIVENVAWDNIPFTKKIVDLAKSTSAVCFGTLAQRSVSSRKTIREFLNSVPNNCIKIFDINLRQHFYSKNIIDESLKITNILKSNDDELKIVADLYNLNDLSEQHVCLRLKEQFSLDIIILTKGTDGSFVFSNEEISFQPTPKVNVVDTVGAGDSFTAAFTAAYLNGKSIREAHLSAVNVSASVCQHHGGMPNIFSQAHHTPSK